MIIEITELSNTKKKVKGSLNTVKWINVYIVGVSQRREKKKILKKVMTDNFLSLMKYFSINIQET